jgi:hypothetical protein
MLIDHLTAGFSLDEFLETVPSLERAQAQLFLELAGEQMKECASFLTNAWTLGFAWHFPETRLRLSRKWSGGRSPMGGWWRQQFRISMSLWPWIRISNFRTQRGLCPLGSVVLVTRFNHLAAYRPQFAEIRDAAMRTRPGQVNVVHIRWRLFSPTSIESMGFPSTGLPAGQFSDVAPSDQYRLAWYRPDESGSSFEPVFRQ